MTRPFLTVLVAALVALFLAHARRHAFVQDDAYVFLRYAENVLEGHGPVWNPGERVEGYSSPAWLAWATAASAVSRDPVPLLHVSTVALALLTLALAFHLARRLADSTAAGVLTLGVAATDRTFAVWSTSGMETRLFGALALGASALAWSLRDAPRAGRGWFLGGVLVALSLARPEGVLLSLLVLGFAAGGVAAGRRPALIAAAVWAAGVALHLGFRLRYYGRLLPNTFYAKVTGPEPASGLAYLGDYLRSFPLTAALVLACLLGCALRRGRTAFEVHAGTLAAAWLGYLLLIGGDFMEFRMLDVLATYGYVVAAAVAVRVWDRATIPAARWGVVALAGAVAAGNVVADRGFERAPHFVLSQRALGEQTTERWAEVGRWLARIAEPGESLATTAAGAIPYYSKLPCVDMLGLNDPGVADWPVDPRGRVGHRRRIPPEMLAQRGVTFVVGEPRLSSAPDFGRLRPGQLVLRVEPAGRDAARGRRWYLLVETTRDPFALARSLRRRGVAVTF